MQVRICPHCRVSVIPSADGICPSCRRSFQESPCTDPPMPALDCESSDADGPLESWSPGGESDSASSTAWDEAQINPYASPRAVQPDDASVATKPLPSNTLVWIALAVPVLAAVGECFVESLWLAMALSFAAVVVTSILIYIDALRLGSRDSHGVERTSPGMLLFGGVLLWIVCYPMAFFRRRHYGGPNLGWVSLLVAAIFAGLPMGLSLVIPRALPACDSSEVKQLLVQIVGDSPSFKQRRAVHPQIDGHHEIGFDSEKQIRTGKCTLHDNDTDIPLTYTITWQDRGKALFYVKVQNEGALPACDSSEVKEVLMRIVVDLPRFKQRPARHPQIDGHREIRFDSENQIRTGNCILHTDDGDIPLTYTVTWQDGNKTMFYVKVQEP